MTISSEKRNQLILAVLVLVAALAGIYYGFISSQLRGLKIIGDEKTAAKTKLAQVSEAKKNAAKIEADLAASRKRLATQEEDVASGDVYAWMVNFIRKFKAGYDVEIPQFSKAQETEENLLPNFPYKQVSITIAGTAYYEDLGRFVADFENQHPTARIVNLSVEPAVAASSGSGEKLSFRMEIVTLAKPSA